LSPGAFVGQASTRTLAGAVVRTAATNPFGVTVAHDDSTLGAPPAARAFGAIALPAATPPTASDPRRKRRRDTGVWSGSGDGSGSTIRKGYPAADRSMRVKCR
jgi:hypothetical protein